MQHDWITRAESRTAYVSHLIFFDFNATFRTWLEQKEQANEVTLEAGKKKAKTKTHKKQAGKRETSSVAVNSADFVVLVIFQPEVSRASKQALKTAQ